MFDAQDHLEIFENFRTDFKLPKHVSPANESINDVNKIAQYLIRTTELDWAQRNPYTINVNALGGITVREIPPRKPWWYWLFRWLPFKIKIEWEPKEMSVEEFFTRVKAVSVSLQLVQERAHGYEDAILQAKACGQKALVESLTKNLTAVRAEAHLVDLGLTKYLTEADLVKFVKLARKGLRLDWIGNFMRMVPAELLVKKIMCDERFVFDNYVVLHYDPDRKAWGETDAEKESRKDPILFGVMDGRRVLYYIGDWVDEFCDLTLDQVADVLGKNGGSVSALSTDTQEALNHLITSE